MNDCLCSECQETKARNDFVVAYIISEHEEHPDFMNYGRDLYEDALVAWYRWLDRHTKDPYTYGIWMSDAMRKIRVNRLSDERFSVISDGSIITHYKEVDPASKYNVSIVGTYVLPEVASYVADKISRAAEKKLDKMFIEMMDAITQWNWLNEVNDVKPKPLLLDEEYVLNFDRAYGEWLDKYDNFYGE